MGGMLFAQHLKSKNNEPYFMNCLRQKAWPEPDLKYRSSSIAVFSSGTAIGDEFQSVNEGSGN
jgi:hypothetical protein